MILKDVSKRTAEDLITFIYNGEVKIESKCLNNFLSVARTLDIKGLTDINHSQQSESFDANQSRPNSPLNGIQYQSTHSNHHLIYTTFLNEKNPVPNCSIESNDFQLLMDEFESDDWIDYENMNGTNDFDHTMETNNSEIIYEKGNATKQNGQANDHFLGDLEIEYANVPTAKRVKRNNGKSQ